MYFKFDEFDDYLNGEFLLAEIDNFVHLMNVLLTRLLRVGVRRNRFQSFSCYLSIEQQL